MRLSVAGKHDAVSGGCAAPHRSPRCVPTELRPWPEPAPGRRRASRRPGARGEQSTCRAVAPRGSKRKKAPRSAAADPSFRGSGRPRAERGAVELSGARGPRGGMH